jgi:hypothetical protein
MPHTRRLRSNGMRRYVLVLCTFVVAGCSGGSKPHGISPLAYAQRADKVCARYNAEIADLHDGGNSVQRLAAVAARTHVLLDRAVSQLQAIPRPRGREVRARRWLDSLERLRRDVVAIRTAAQANDLAGIRRLALVAERDDARSNALARRLGLQACSSG